MTWSPAPAQTTPSAAASATFGYGYDATNRRVSQSATDNSWWSYPTTATSVSYTANNLNQYIAIGSVTPTYDGNGNLTSDGSFTYGYDAENRLISASGTGLSATYAYDAQGRRKSKTVNGTTTIFVTDADNREVLEYDGSSGAIQNWYAYALGPNDMLNQMNVASGRRATFTPDIQGSFVGTLDANSGTLAKNGYQAYGESGSTSGSFRYTGQRMDPETNGLYYYRAREYMPPWGRFMQVDPIGYTGGSNLYRYVGNDPLNLTDPYGWAPDSPEAQAGGGGNGVQPPTVAAAAPAEEPQNSNQNNIQLAAMISPWWERPPLVEGGGSFGFGGGSTAGGRSFFEPTPAPPTANPSTPSVVGGGAGPNFVVTPGGTAVVVPKGYTATPALNEQGLVLSPPGQSLYNNSNIVRYGEPNAFQSGGVFPLLQQFGSTDQSSHRRTRASFVNAHISQLSGSAAKLSSGSSIANAAL